MNELAQDYFMRSDRLGFRWWTQDDLPLAATLWGNPQVTRLFYKTPLTADQVGAKLEMEIGCANKHQIQYWPVFSLADAVFLGCAGLRPYTDGALELGVHLLPEFWQRGYASEAAAYITQYAFEKQLANVIFAGHHPRNEGSRRTLLKAGFLGGRAQYYEPTGLVHPSYFTYHQPPKSVAFCKAEATDAAGLAIVHHHSIKATFGGLLDDYVQGRSLDYCENSWHRRLAEGEASTIVLMRGKQIVGFASVAHSADLDATATDGEISRIYLHPAVLGKGYGSKLMSWCEEALKKQGYEVMRLWVFAVNARARRFYEKAGFKPDGRAKQDFGADILRYTKSLAALSEY